MRGFSRNERTSWKEDLHRSKSYSFTDGRIVLEFKVRSVSVFIRRKAYDESLTKASLEKAGGSGFCHDRKGWRGFKEVGI